MGTTSRVTKWGTSLAIRIPKAIAQQWGVSEGSAIEIIPREDHVVLRKETHNLDDMLAQVTVDNPHSEQDSGPAQGDEEW